MDDLGKAAIYRRQNTDSPFVLYNPTQPRERRWITVEQGEGVLSADPPRDIISRFWPAVEGA